MRKFKIGQLVKIKWDDSIYWYTIWRFHKFPKSEGVEFKEILGIWSTKEITSKMRKK